MKIRILILFLSILFIFSCKTESKKGIRTITAAVPIATSEKSKKFEINPISHASMSLLLNGNTLYVDPVGNLSDYENKKQADIILITHKHPDHFNSEIIQHLTVDSTKIVIPQSLSDSLPENLISHVKLLNNGDSLLLNGIKIFAFPMYNMREEARYFHQKGDGNGYVLEYSDLRIYIAGDTGPIPEMKKLKNIDIAFIPMNLPYTMSVADAADAVLAFRPKKVYPYHYKGTNGFSDVKTFKNYINTNDATIQVVQLDWYKNAQ